MSQIESILLIIKRALIVLPFLWPNLFVQGQSMPFGHQKIDSLIDADQIDSGLYAIAQNLQYLDSIGEIHSVDRVRQWVAKAKIHKIQSKFVKADSMLQSARTLLYKFDSSHLLNMRILNDLGSVAFSASRYPEAIMYYREVRRNLQRDTSVHREGFFTNLGNLGSALSRAGQISEANTIYLELETTSRAHLDTNGIQFGNIMSSLGIYWLTSGRVKESLVPLQKAARIYYSKYGRSSHYALKLSNLASAYMRIGEYEDAESRFVEALAIFKETLGVENPKYASSLNSLAVNMYYQGRYNEALHYFLESLDVVEETLGRKHSDFGDIANNIGQIFTSLGQDREALKYTQLSLENTLQNSGEQSSAYLTTLVNEGIIYRGLKEPEAAMKSFRRALALQRSVDTTQTQFGSIIGQIGSVYYDQEISDSALHYHKIAVRHAAEHTGKQTRRYDVRVNNLANTYSQLGNQEKAIELLQEVRATTLKTRGNYHPEYVTRLSNIASVFQKMNNLDSASIYYQQANSIIVDLFDTYYPALGERERLAYLEKNAVTLNKHFSFSMAYDVVPGDVAIDLLELSLRTKGLALDQSISTRLAALSSGDQKLNKMQKIWVELRNRIGKSRLNPTSSEEVLDSLQAEALKIERIMSNLSTSVAKTFQNYPKSSLSAFEEIRGVLEFGECALEFVEFQYLDGSRLTDSNYYFVQIIKPSWSEPKLIHIGEERDIQQHLSEGFIRDPRQLAALHRILVEPVIPYLDEVHRIFWSPDGILHKVPWGAIAKQKLSLNALMPIVSRLNNLRHLPTLKKHQNQYGDIALFGNVQFTMDSLSLADVARPGDDIIAFQPFERGTDSTRSRYFSPLPQTAIEIAKIGNSLEIAGWDVNYHTDKEASEEQFLTYNGQGPDVLHLATHGFFFKEYRGTYKASNLRERVVTSSEPLFRSGLALSGVNHVWQGGEPIPGVEDGILTAFEIAGLDLSGTELAVLSACETALGDIENSEGVFGLQRAFKMAGAEKLILSLWKVPDQETQILMTKFYEFLILHGDPAIALHKVQVEMSQTYEPYFWAGFILME